MKLRKTIAWLEQTLSPPSRGAWIEMPIKQEPSKVQLVAPLAGGVD